MPTAFDTTHDCSTALACLQKAGYDTLIRYYARPELTWKRLGVREAAAIAASGMKLAVVYQDRQNQDGDFSEASGSKAGRRAYDYAHEVIHQPAGSAIYFSADYDPSTAAITDRIIPFFESIKAAFYDSDGGPAYKIGVYGSGRTCRMLLEKGLVDYCWITQSTGFQEYKEFVASGAWHLKQLMPGSVCGIGGDPNEVNPARHDFGAFTLDASEYGPAAPSDITAPQINASARQKMIVIASGGLRIRSGPGVNFDVSGSLAPLAKVYVISRVGDWAMIDASGDGLADGFVHSAYLHMP